MVFGLPLVCYFFDCGVGNPAGPTEESIETFLEFSDVLGAELKAGKSKWGARVQFLGLRGSPQRSDNRGNLKARLTPGEPHALGEEISDIIKSQKSGM